MRVEGAHETLGTEPEHTMKPQMDENGIYLNIKAREATSPESEYLCWHKLSMTSNQLDLVESVTYRMLGQGFKEPNVTSMQAPFVMKFGPCWGLPHVTIEVLLKSGVVLSGLFDDNLPSEDACIQLGQLNAAAAPVRNAIQLHVKALEETSPAFEYRCWHKLWLSSSQPDHIRSVTFKMPGQGFREPTATSPEAPFIMQFGPCWGLPHVAIDVLLVSGEVLQDLYDDNLPSEDACIQLVQIDAPIAPTLERTATTNLTLSLNALRNVEPGSVHNAITNLQKHGFVFLNLEGDELLEAAKVLNAAHSFLAGPGRNTGSRSAIVGHISSQHKDSIRLLTGDQWTNNPKLPFSNRLHQLALAFDAAQISIIAALATPLFGCPNATAVAKAFDVPLTWEPGDLRGFGLLDIVLYRMEAGAPSPLAVSEHVDPGLLILSLPQSSEGLELQDAAGEWCSPPRGLGVLWAGAKAVQAGVRGGRHRVRSGATPRLSCWHEVCTNEQITLPMLQRIASQNIELQLGAVKGTERVLRTLRKAEDHDMRAGRLVGMLGAPMSKSGPMRIHARLDDVGDDASSDGI